MNQIRLRERGSEGIVCPKRATSSFERLTRTNSAYRSRSRFGAGSQMIAPAWNIYPNIGSSLRIPFVSQCDLLIPTVSLYDCTLPLTIPNDAKASACAFPYTPNGVKKKKEPMRGWVEVCGEQTGRIDTFRSSANEFAVYLFDFPHLRCKGIYKN